MTTTAPSSTRKNTLLICFAALMLAAAAYLLMRSAPKPPDPIDEQTKANLERLQQGASTAEAPAQPPPASERGAGRRAVQR